PQRLALRSPALDRSRNRNFSEQCPTIGVAIELEQVATRANPWSYAATSRARREEHRFLGILRHQDETDRSVACIPLDFCAAMSTANCHAVRRRCNHRRT